MQNPSFGRAILGLFAGMLALATPAHATPQPRPDDRALHALFDREYQRDLRLHPEGATFNGDDRYNDRLTDLSFPAIAAEKAHTLALMRELKAIPETRLNTQDRISRALMLDGLRLQAEADALYGPLPFNGLHGWSQVGPNNGPQYFLAGLVKATPFRNVRDYENYLKRLALVPHSLEQLTAILREGMRSGWMPPSEVMAHVPEQFDPFLGSDLAANPLWMPFTKFPEQVPEAERARLAAAGREAIAARVTPAFVRMKAFVEHDYIPASRRSLAASDLPAGQRYYALAVEDQTTTSMTPEQVHELGLSEVKRIGDAMDALVAQQGFKGTRREYMEMLKADPKNYFTGGEDMLRAYRDIAKRVDAELPALFATLPRLPYGIRAMEAFEGDNAEHYTPGALDGSRAGWFEANVNHLSTRPIYEMEDTFLHEAVPGHHLQNARAQEIPGLPEFRRTGWYVAYGEGWALYAESLGPALGMYTDPKQRMGSYSWEMVRACRLVVDTGLHAMHWTRPQAIEYMVDNAGISREFAASEVDRYVVQPGQALGYKIGELKIKALRAKAEAALKARFDIRRFHNAVLDDGPVPLSLLERRIDEWIAAEKLRTAATSPG